MHVVNRVLFFDVNVVVVLICIVLMCIVFCVTRFFCVVVLRCGVVK